MSNIDSCAATSVLLLKNGTEAFPAMLEAIDQAADCIALEMYVFGDDRTGKEFRRHLADAAKRGVNVMVLVDAWGSWNLSDSFWSELVEAGGRVKWFRPMKHGLYWFRNHRKLLLIDNRTAFIGGFNIADEYYYGKGEDHPWRDNLLKISGKEVYRLRRSFVRMWSRAEMPVHRMILRLGSLHRIYDNKSPEFCRNLRFLESGFANPVQPVRKLYRQVIDNAKIGIDLAMGYFYPPGSIMRALKRAVRRGVRVRLLFPRKSDVPAARWAAQGLYGRLFRSGVEIWEYLPAMLHAKLAIVDDTIIAGSANLDIRSGRINYELVAVVIDSALAGLARRHFEADLRQSEQISFHQWKARPWTQKLRERISHWILARADIFVSRTELARRIGQRTQN